MTAKQLIEIIEQYDLFNEDLDEVLRFAKLSAEDTKHLALCGNCAMRGTCVCPWPDSSLSDPPCLDYAKRIQNK